MNTAHYLGLFSLLISKSCLYIIIVVTSNQCRQAIECFQVIVHLITLAMERKNEFRELSSQLIKYFATPSHLNQKNVEATNGRILY